MSKHPEGVTVRRVTNSPWDEMHPVKLNSIPAHSDRTTGRTLGRQGDGQQLFPAQHGGGEGTAMPYQGCRARTRKHSSAQNVNRVQVHLKLVRRNKR